MQKDCYPLQHFISRHLWPVSFHCATEEEGGGPHRYELNNVSVILHRFSISWGRLQQRILGHVLYSATWDHRDIGLNETRTGKKKNSHLHLCTNNRTLDFQIQNTMVSGWWWMVQTNNRTFNPGDLCVCVPCETKSVVVFNSHLELKMYNMKDVARISAVRNIHKWLSIINRCVKKQVLTFKDNLIILPLQFQQVTVLCFLQALRFIAWNKQHKLKRFQERIVLLIFLTKYNNRPLNSSFIKLG